MAASAKRKIRVSFLLVGQPDLAFAGLARLAARLQILRDVEVDDHAPGAGIAARLDADAQLVVDSLGDADRGAAGGALPDIEIVEASRPPHAVEQAGRNGQFPIIRLSRIALPPGKSGFSGRYCRLIMKDRYIRKPCAPWRGNSIFSRPRLSRRRQGRFNPASSRPAKRRHSPREGRRPRFETTWMNARLRFLIPFRDSMVASIGRPDCVG